MFLNNRFLIIILLFYLNQFVYVDCYKNSEKGRTLSQEKIGCRPETKTRQCEKLCNNGTCEIHAVIILTNNSNMIASSNRVMPILQLAHDDVMKSELLPRNLNIKWHSRNDNCSTSLATIAAIDSYSDYCAHVIFGPVADYPLASVGRIVQYLGYAGTPLLTVGGLSFEFQEPKRACDDEFYMNVRVGMITFSEIAQFLKALIEKYNWTSMAFLFDPNSQNEVAGSGTCFLMMKNIKEKLKMLKNFNHTIVDLTVSLNKSSMRNTLINEIGVKYGVIVMCVNKTTVREVMLSAADLNMTSSGEYVFFNIDLDNSNASAELAPWYGKSDSNATNLKARDAFSAFMIIKGTIDPDQSHVYLDRTKNLTERLRRFPYSKVKRHKDNYRKISKRHKFVLQKKQVPTIVASFYDAFWLYAYALNETLEELVSWENFTPLGSKIVEKMKNRTFQGVTGEVNINENGDRISNTYTILNMNPNTHIFEEAVYYKNQTLIFSLTRPIYWPGNQFYPPKSEPICGFDNSKCPDTSLSTTHVLIIILISIIFILPILFYITYRPLKREAEIARMSWKVDWEQVNVFSTGGKIDRCFSWKDRRASQITNFSDDCISIAEGRQIFAPVGLYKGSKVALKYLPKTKIELSRPILLELKTMTDLQHNHITKFYGACLDAPKPCILIEYASRGSLQDILENEGIKLALTIQLSLMHDIIRGMNYLHHSQIRSHGNLKSSNCVVDGRFVLKITDFGMHQLIYKCNINNPEDQNDYAYWKKKLWTSPELLRLPKPILQGTQKGDVYSFGIIVQEIMFRQGPFYIEKENYSPRALPSDNNGLTNEDGKPSNSPRRVISPLLEVRRPHCTLNCDHCNGILEDRFKHMKIVESVARGISPSSQSPLRPSIEEGCEEEIASLMKKCWAEDIADRPDFPMLKNIIRKLNKDYESGNLLDNLLNRMENYANNLETLVEERTADYLEEKRKCEELLYQLLPKSVASQLIRGQSVIAETYDQVTICFTDIVGFTTLSAESTPMQVVDFLNDLFTCFDSIIENYDVYKIETIGDAYMVVSGLPVRNGSLHCREIARVSLAQLEEVRKFKIRHRPRERLMLRIGAHTGPCVAGVVGLKMPRYCLFGDTVNTASRMESNGAAMRIHVSSETANVLKSFETFQLEMRGEIEIKGKGKMSTYWLNGENPAPSNEANKLPLVNICSHTEETNPSVNVEIVESDFVEQSGHNLNTGFNENASVFPESMEFKTKYSNEDSSANIPLLSNHTI